MKAKNNLVILHSLVMAMENRYSTKVRKARISDAPSPEVNRKPC